MFHYISVTITEFNGLEGKPFYLCNCYDHADGHDPEYYKLSLADAQRKQWELVRKGGKITWEYNRHNPHIVTRTVDYYEL